jgi:surface carbohydrate biosynthesis protein (TIGR04326 family)
MTELLVLDVGVVPESYGGDVLLWRDFSCALFPEAVSIPLLVEGDADHLRERYLAWVHELGEAVVDGRRVVDWMVIRPGFSAWWMTSVAEKCNYDKSPWIDDAIKLMVFDEWASERLFKRIRLFSANSTLAECISDWCTRYGVGFEWVSADSDAVRSGTLHRTYRRIPAPIRAVVWLIRYLFARWSLRGVGVDAWKNTAGRICFVSYLLYLDEQAFAAKRYASRFWADLPDKLRAEGLTTNWLHIFVKNSLVPNARAAARAISDYNAASSGAQAHVALESFLSIKVVAKAAIDWFHLVRISPHLENGLSRITSNGLTLWPMFRQEWQEATAGPIAMNNQLYVTLFEQAFSSLPKQERGVYLQENMDWEYPCLWSWRAHGHDQIIGCAHSTVRYWDLRYFFDRRTLDGVGECAMPTPDIVALNGPAAEKTFRSGGYPMENTTEVEALRYLQFGALPLNGSMLTPSATQTKTRILVLGDYSQRHTEVQLQLLLRAMQVPGMRERVSITVKPHISNVIVPGDYPSLDFDVSMAPIVDLLAQCDLAYTSAATSAAVDAYCAGVSVAVFLDPEVLNQSPLRGWSSVYFVASPEDLIDAIGAVEKGTRIYGRANLYFNLAQDLRSWKVLLACKSADSKKVNC